MSVQPYSLFERPGGLRGAIVRRYLEEAARGADLGPVDLDDAARRCVRELDEADEG